MQIVKLASGEKVKVKITVNYKTGEADVRVVDNPNAQGCPTGFNEALIRDLLEAEAPEYGEVTITDSGLTEEGFAARDKNRTKPLPYNPLKPTPTKPIASPQTDEEEAKKKLDTGFGV